MLKLQIPYIGFRSIRTRIMASTILLIVSLVGTIVGLWAQNEREFYQKQKLKQSESISRVLSQSLQVELGEENWGTMRNRLDILMKDNPDILYSIISDHQRNDRIVVAAPYDLENKYIPDIVPLEVTKKAIIPSPQGRHAQTFLVKDIYHQSDEVRAKKGEKILEIAMDIVSSSDATKAVGTLRLGITLKDLDEAIRQSILKATVIGGFGLGFGLLGSYFLARKLSEPVLKLQGSAAKIAAGDLDHRAEIHLSDEIGALATSFNDMSRSLQTSFNRLQETLNSFERFVPNKFLSAIAPNGIENIHVGEAVKKNVTILFSDIRNYTAMSESMTSIDVFNFLNEYLAYMGKPIEENGGFIDKYIGDAIMALFDDESSDSSLDAAIAMQQSLEQYNQVRQARGQTAIAIGIGLHYGEVIMGTVGFTSRIDSTVIGDTVNLASRVESLTKQYQVKILLTDAVIQSLKNPQRFQFKLVEQGVKIKGKEVLVDLYELHFRI